MKKVILLTLAALVLMSGAAFATESRVRALGMYSAPYICDDYNLFTWYATLPSYSNLVIINMWNGDDYFEYDHDYYNDPEDGGFEEHAAYYGMTYALGDEGSWGTLGLFLMQNYHSPNENQWLAWEIWGSWDDYSRVAHDDYLESKWIVMYGKELTEKMGFGLYFARASEKWKYSYDDGTAYEEEGIDAYTTIGVGFKMEITEDLTGEVAFDWTKVTDTYKETDEDDIEMDPGKAMALRARAGYAWSEDINLIGYVDWATKDFAMSPVEDEYFDEGFGYKEMGFTFGIGANITVNEDNMILFAVEPYSMTKIEPSGYTEGYEETWEMTYRAMPRFILALESDLTDWLTFRTGCSKDLAKASWKWEDADETEEDEWTDFSDYSFKWNLGLGFHFGDFDIDCVLNKNIPFSMGYWLTGYGPGNNTYEDDGLTPIGMVSAVYHF